MATEKDNAKITAFAAILNSSNETISSKRAERWSRMGTTASDAIVTQKQAEVDRLQEAIDNHTDISTSNDLQTANRIGEFKGETFAATLHDLEEKLAIAEDMLKIAKRTNAKWFK